MAMFEKYRSLQPKQDDSEQVRREKARARNILAERISMIESRAGLKYHAGKSSIAMICDHRNPTKGYVFPVYPTLDSYRNGDWDYIDMTADLDHRRKCAGWRAIKEDNLPTGMGFPLRRS